MDDDRSEVRNLSGNVGRKQLAIFIRISLQERGQVSESLGRLTNMVMKRVTIWMEIFREEDGKVPKQCADDLRIAYFFIVFCTFEIYRLYLGMKIFCCIHGNFLLFHQKCCSINQF